MDRPIQVPADARYSRAPDIRDQILDNRPTGKETRQVPLERMRSYAPSEFGQAKGEGVEAVRDTAQWFIDKSADIAKSKFELLRDSIESELPEGFEGTAVVTPADYDTGNPTTWNDNYYTEVTVYDGPTISGKNSGVRTMEVKGRNKSAERRLEYNKSGKSSFQVQSPNGKPTTVNVDRRTGGRDFADTKGARDAPADARYDRGYKDQVDKARDGHKDATVDNRTMDA